MRINVIGAGPSGLYFAYLMKKSFPGHLIRVFERNSAAATFGFGVVFSGRALPYLAEGDPDLVDRLYAHMEVWSDQHIRVHGETVVLDGSSYAAIERLTLLHELQQACLGIGVEIRFDTAIDDPSILEDSDLLVGADGANSTIRDWFGEAFGTRVTDLGNFYAWYGVDHPYPAHTLTFERSPDGVFCGHHYRYRPDRSTFISEVDTATWHSSGMYAMSNDERQALCERLFHETLKGNKLLSNRSVWRRYRLVRNDRWHFGKVVLLGDALHTAHPSIGSGTRLAMEDSIALWRAFVTGDNQVHNVLRAYEAARRPIRDKLNQAAARSIAWYEEIAGKLDLAPYDFAYDYALRTGVVTPERLATESPLFVQRYEEQPRKQVAGGP